MNKMKVFVAPLMGIGFIFSVSAQPIVDGGVAYNAQSQFAMVKVPLNATITSFVNAYSDKALDTLVHQSDIDGEWLGVWEVDGSRKKQVFNVLSDERIMTTNTEPGKPYKNYLSKSSDDKLVGSRAGGDAYEYWSNNDGTYAIKHKLSGKYLGIERCSVDNGVKLKFFDAAYAPCGAYSDSIRWRLTGDVGISNSVPIEFSVRNAKIVNNYSRKVFDVEGGGVSNFAKVLQYESGKDLEHQTFHIIPLYQYTNTGKPLFKIASAKDERFVLDASGPSGSWRQQIQMYNYEDVMQQKWMIERHPNGAYRFINQYYNQDIGLETCDKNNGTPLRMRDWYSSNTPEDNKPECQAYGASMLWTINPPSSVNGDLITDSRFERLNVSLVNKGNNLALDVADGKMSPGSYLQTWSMNSTPAQRFDIKFMGVTYNFTSSAIPYFKIVPSVSPTLVLKGVDSMQYNEVYIRLSDVAPSIKEDTGWFVYHNPSDDTYSFKSAKRSTNAAWSVKERTHLDSTTCSNNSGVPVKQGNGACSDTTLKWYILK